MKSFPFPLRFSIPIILILHGGLLSLISFHKEITETYQKTEKTTKNYVQLSASRTAEILDYLFRRGDNEQAETLVSQLGSNPNLKSVLLLDDHNFVLISSDYEMNLRPANETSAVDYLSKFATVRKKMAGEVFLSEDKQRLIAIFPVLLQALSGELRSSRIGLLFIEYDLTQIKQEAYVDGLKSSLVFSGTLMVFCLGLWFFFELTLTQRIANLVAASNSLADGQLSVRTGLSGSDEIAQISLAFERIVTKIQENTRELARSKQRYKLVASATNKGIWDWNLKTKLFYYSPNWLKILGYSPNALPFLFSTWLKRLHPEDRDSVRQAIHSHLAGITEIHEHTYRMQHRDGHYIWVAAKGKCLRDPQGKVYRMVGTITDITAQKQAEQELKIAKESAEMTSQAKSQFLAKMTHELRTPLTAILGFTNLISRDNSLSAEHKNYLEIISRSGEHLLSLINEVLKMSKIEAGKVSLHENFFDLHRLLHSVQNIFIFKTIEKGIELKLKIDSEIPQYVYADEGKLRQIILNLISNAVKFTLEGYVIIRVWSKQEIEKETPTKEQSEEVPSQKWILCFEIEDSGIGISPRHLDLIFEDFRQTGYNYNSEGTGLGLSISRQFARLMGGNITVKSTPGRGSTFFCQIQLSVSKNFIVLPSQTTRRVVGLEQGQPSYRILVVDDVLENRQLIVNLLESIGLETRSAKNGREALELWQSWHPHLIWMDIQMPEMNGYEVTREIKNTIKGEETKIIALTASVFDKDCLASETGCDDFVDKPFSEDILFDKMTEHLGLKYVYAQETQSELSQVNSFEQLTANDLQVMGKDWLAQMSQAALLLDESTLRELISQMPIEQQVTANNLNHLLDQLQLEKILELTQT